MEVNSFTLHTPLTIGAGLKGKIIIFKFGSYVYFLLNLTYACLH